PPEGSSLPKTRQFAWAEVICPDFEVCQRKTRTGYRAQAGGGGVGVGVGCGQSGGCMGRLVTHSVFNVKPLFQCLLCSELAPRHCRPSQAIRCGRWIRTARTKDEMLPTWKIYIDVAITLMM